MEGLINKMKGIRKDPNRVLFPKSGNSLPSSLGSHSASGGVAASPLLNKRFTLPFLAVLAALALGLLFLLPGGLLQAQQNNMTMVNYAENGEDAVATFTATDPEGATPITWSLATSGQVDAEDDLADADNADAGDFTIDKDGMLKFDIDANEDGSSLGSPDFENGQGSGTGNNTYKVVVVACDVALVSDACPDTGEAGYHKVTVMVTDVDEDGEVSWTTDANADNTVDAPKLMQFQVGNELSASVMDGDIEESNKTVEAARTDVEADPTWRWYRSSSKTSMGTVIDGENSATYTVTTADVGMYLRAVAYYLVTGNVDQETASLTSDYPVLAVRPGVNKLKFSPDALERSVQESKKGMNVGNEVTATGNHGAVNYTLVGDDDDDKFKIDQKTGQITTDVDLDYDAAAAAQEANCRDGDHCTVTVRATDASGSATAGTATDDPPVFVDATVTIKVTDVNDKPEFPTAAMTRIEVAENITELDTTDDNVTYTATDPEDRSLTYRLMGPDRAKFELSNTQVLSFREKPDYEKPADANKDNMYEVTVRASDGTMYADRMVKVTVTGVDDAPAVMGKDSVSYTENGEDAVATFTATDPEGVTPITWSIATDTQVSEEDDLADADNTDAGDFMIDKDGMLKFDIDAAEDGSSLGSPDFENGQGSGTGNNTYKVVVVACDVALVSDACPDTGKAGYHKVTVMVTDVVEKGKVTWTVNPNGTVDAPNANVLDTDDTPIMQFQVGALLTASVIDGDVEGNTKTVNTPVWRWYRGNTRIPDADAEDNTYTVTTGDERSRLRVEVKYYVGDSTTQETASLTADYPVLAVRPGVNKLKFSPDALERSVQESKKGMNVGNEVTATGNHGAVNYTLVGDDDDDKFKIDQKTGQITTDVDLDYDAAAAVQEANCRDGDHCTVTVRATDASASATAGTATDDPPVFVDATVTIKVTDVNEKPEFDSTDDAMSPMRITREENNTPLFENEATGGQPTTAGDVTYTAMDPDGLNVNLTLMGTDGDKFSLSSGGVLSFREKPDYEMPADANKDNVYMVTVRASDGTLYEDRMVEVTVTDVDEAPMIIWGGLGISGSSSVSYADDRRDAVATYTAIGPNAASARWSLAGADAGDFRIDSRSGVLTFSTSPDFDNPADANGDNVYMVMVKARDSEDNMAERQVTVTVTGMDDTTPTPGDSLIDEYDTDNSDSIERPEVIRAIQDYFQQPVGTVLDRPSVIKVIQRYFADLSGGN